MPNKGAKAAEHTHETGDQMVVDVDGDVAAAIAKDLTAAGVVVDANKLYDQSK
eukprot:COSAG04_NODE_11023_length_736_cov_0.843014_2_plen_53_part_00